MVPLVLSVALVSVVVVAAIMLRQPTAPTEIVVSTTVALVVVLLTEIIRQTLGYFEQRRRFSFLMLELHDEMSGHLEYIRVAKESLSKEPTPDKDTPWIVEFPFIARFQTTAWERFLLAGGLSDMFDYAPAQIAANLHRYHNGVDRFNDEVERRERVLDSYYSVDRAVETMEIASRILDGNRRSSDEALRRLLGEMERRLPHLLLEMQSVLMGLGGLPTYFVWMGPKDMPVPAQLTRLWHKDSKAYCGWRQRHGLPPLDEPPSKGDDQGLLPKSE